MRFKEARIKAGLTQVEAAEQLGIAQPTISAWERGVNEPRASLLGAIAKLYKTSVVYLLELDGDDS